MCEQFEDVATESPPEPKMPTTVTLKSGEVVKIKKTKVLRQNCITMAYPVTYFLEHMFYRFGKETFEWVKKMYREKDLYFPNNECIYRAWYEVQWKIDPKTNITAERHMDVAMWGKLTNDSFQEIMRPMFAGNMDMYNADYVRTEKGNKEVHAYEEDMTPGSDPKQIIYTNLNHKAATTPAMNKNASGGFTESRDPEAGEMAWSRNCLYYEFCGQEHFPKWIVSPKIASYRDKLLLMQKEENNIGYNGECDGTETFAKEVRNGYGAPNEKTKKAWPKGGIMKKEQDIKWVVSRTYGHPYLRSEK